LARVYVGNGAYKLHTIGVVDDLSDADGKVILNFSQAQTGARKLMVAQAGGGVGTVGDAMTSYLKRLEDDARSQAAIARTRYTINAFILPTLGHIELAKLTHEQIDRWFKDLARKPARLRTSKGKAQRHRAHSDDAGIDADVRRARRVTANRHRTMLIAALNAAFLDGHVASDQAWRRVRPHKGVDKARLRYLSIAESKRLINAADPEFRPLLTAALLTGARYGSLIILVASDFNADAGTLRLRTRKGDGSERVFHVHLTDEAQEFFVEACVGKRGGDLVFTHDNGLPWKKNHQQLPMIAASKGARILPAVNYHVTRHTFASHSVMAGVPLLVVAAALGHSDTRMVEKHYGHLSPSYAADAIRKGAPNYGLKSGNVQTLR
jgi:prepilin-type processing-associated H-X9-DG protein